MATVAAVRQDIRYRDIFARWGGEEFMILLPGTDLDAAVSLAERLRISLEGMTFSSGAHVTGSFGVTQYHPGDTADTILVRVDGCLYRSKMEGKNRVCAETEYGGDPGEAASLYAGEDEGQTSLFYQRNNR